MISPSIMAPRAQLASQQMQYEPALAPRALPSSKDFHEVWNDNLDEEFRALLAAVSSAGGSEAFLALDTEFPGFPCQDPQNSSPMEHYKALRLNVDQLWPIQLGVAVVGTNGVHHGVWTFNLHFDATVDAHTEESLSFLRAAGLDFPRHRTEGIRAMEFGQRLANSSLVGAHGGAPCWLTFSGSYDWGYLLKLVTLGRALPGPAGTFDQVLSVYCPKRRELRDLLPKGSLESLGRRHGVKRLGSAHTAGSDALMTLELFMLLGGPKLVQDAGKVGDVRQNQWNNWQNTDELVYPGSAEPWYIDETGSQVSSAWENNIWPSEIPSNKNLAWGDSSVSTYGNLNQTNNDWFSQTGQWNSQNFNNAQGWYSNQFQSPWYASL